MNIYIWLGIVILDLTNKHSYLYHKNIKLLINNVVYFRGGQVISPDDEEPQQSSSLFTKRSY